MHYRFVLYLVKGLELFSELTDESTV